MAVMLLLFQEYLIAYKPVKHFKKTNLHEFNQNAWVKGFEWLNLCSNVFLNFFFMLVAFVLIVF